MGRSFLSIRQAINLIAERWARTSRLMGRDEKTCGRTTADLAKTHASEAFFGCDYPLEGAVFSVMVELGKRLEADVPGRGGEPPRENNPPGFSQK